MLGFVRVAIYASVLWGNNQKKGERKLSMDRQKFRAKALSEAKTSPSIYMYMYYRARFMCSVSEIRRGMQCNTDFAFVFVCWYMYIGYSCRYNMPKLPLIQQYTEWPQYVHC